MFEDRPIYGHIRFSFYGVTDTVERPDEDGSALARLYDETRMARRFFLFENLTLPSLIHQTDGGFKTVIMSSDVMPDRYKDRLSKLAERLPGAVVEYSPHRHGDQAFHRFVIEAAGYKVRGSSVHFRLDDDDAVSVNYISRLRHVSRVLSPSTHITFPTGIFLFPARPDAPDGVSMMQQRFLTAIGLATVNGGGFHKNPYQMMHGNVWTRWPVVSDPTFFSHIRTQHFENDTVLRQDKIIGALQRERTSRRGHRHAAVVDKALAVNFPWIDRETLDGLLARCDAVRSLDDLPPVA
ncbi:glycosyltransferase [Tabrizicola sp.]|uniref:glycosyltransferase n=1 Tax=Tabrizicola sp. TaxID=2005166 RepID=UPI0035B45107